MHLIDWLILIVYILIVVGIAVKTKQFLKQQFYSKVDAQSSMLVHYIAGRSLTKFEVLFSIVATEVSALTFLMVPGSVFGSNFCYVRFVIGACIGRFVGAKYILPRIYNKGLTIFEILARGVHSYEKLTPDGEIGKRVGAAAYVFLKIFGVAARLAGGALILSQIMGLNIILTIFIVTLLTYLYLIAGGLKAVVRTDVMQGLIFIIGGVVTVFAIGQEGNAPGTWYLFKHAYAAGKFNPFCDLNFFEFLLGITAGFVTDISGHNIDQEMSQKLIGSQSLENARFSTNYSIFISFLVNIVFLIIGALLWSFYQQEKLPSGISNGEIFPHFLLTHFPSPIKGLITAVLLAATMSSLDSAINAMSSCLWNDIFPLNLSFKKQHFFIKMDNLIMSLAVAIYACLISQSDKLFSLALNLNYWAIAPTLGIFLMRLVFSRWVRFTYTWHLIVFGYLFSLMFMIVTKSVWHGSDQLTLMVGVVVTMLFTWPYSWIVKNEKDIYDEAPV